jgi:DNA polymerase-1
MIKVIGIENSSYETSTVDECYEYLSKLDEICVDTETEGLFNFRNNLLLIQLGDRNVQYVINTKKVNVYLFKPLLETKLCLFQNAKFDWKFLKLNDIDVKYIYDTYLTELLLYTGYNFSKPDKPYFHATSLKALALRYCNVELDKTIRGVIHKESSSDRVIEYAANDIAYLQDIRDKQMIEIRKWDLEPVLDLENKVTRVYAIMEYNGMKLDPIKWSKVADVTEANSLAYTAELDKIILEEYKSIPKLRKFINRQTDLFNEEVTTLINWASSQQKQEILNLLGVKVESAEMEVLVKNQSKHKIIPLLIELSKSNKMSTTYGRSFLKYVNPITKRVHTEFWQILSSGRVSSNEPSLLNIPAHGELAEAIKESFVAEEGNLLIDTDFSGFELRIITELSQDPLWLDTFNNDGDLHSILCCKTFDIPLADVKKPFPYKPEVNYRFVQKTINFMLSYGGSEFKLSGMIQTTPKVAKEIINKFFAVVPKVKEFLDMLGATGKKYGRIRSPLPYRRIRFFPQHEEAIRDGNFAELGNIERASKNHPIQGANANITKLALCMIQDRIDLEKLPIKVLLPIHDAIVVEAPKSIQDYTIRVVQEEMIAAAKTTIKSIPVKVDTTYGEYWKH